MLLHGTPEKDTTGSIGAGSAFALLVIMLISDPGAASIGKTAHRK